MAINAAKNGTVSPNVPARAIEKVLVTLWFLVTFTTFPYDELILYPLALYFFYAFFDQRATTLPILIKCWPLMLLPVWAVLTSPFAVVPTTALRSAIQMILTMQVCILLVVWMRPRAIVLTVLAATGICGVLSLFITSFQEGGYTGIFDHKNMLGAKMLLLWAAALCVALDQWMRLTTRAIAISLAFLAFYLILASNSATALVLALLIVTTLGSLSFLAGDGPKTSVDRAAIGLILTGTVGILAAFTVMINETSPVALALEALGKSSTLTGRTDLWDYARDVIRERPYLGHGDGGFWRYEENELVQQIFAEFHKSPSQIFSFHNSFFEIGVSFGLIGLGLTIFTLFWAVVRLTRQMVHRGGMPFLFFPTVAVVELVRSYVESELMRPFVLAHMLIWIGAVYVSRYPLDRTERSRTSFVPARL